MIFDFNNIFIFKIIATLYSCFFYERRYIYSINYYIYKKIYIMLYVYIQVYMFYIIKKGNIMNNIEQSYLYSQ